MNEHQIEERVKSAFTSDIPDNFDVILEKSIAQKEKIVKMPKAKILSPKNMRIIISTAAAVVLIVTAGLVGSDVLHSDKNIGTSDDNFFNATDESVTIDDFFGDTVTQSGSTDNASSDAQSGSTDDNSSNASSSGGHGMQTILGGNTMSPDSVGGGNNDEPTEKKKISPVKAREIALKAAGLTEDQVYEDDYNDEAWWSPDDYLAYPDDAGSSYIIDFRTDLYEYEYSIDPYTGKILSFKKIKKYIGFEKAKELLLQEIGKLEEEITNIEIDFYVGHYMFDISFENASCKAKIDAVTGEIKLVQLEGLEDSNASETESSDTSSTAPENEQN